MEGDLLAENRSDGGCQPGRYFPDWLSDDGDGDEDEELLESESDETQKPVKITNKTS